MQEMGLEPTRYCYHRHLKPARLPIPPLLRAICSISVFSYLVNNFFQQYFKKSQHVISTRNWGKKPKNTLNKAVQDITGI